MKLSLPWKWFIALAIFLAALSLTINLCIHFFLPPHLIGEIQKDLQRNALLAREAFSVSLSAGNAIDSAPVRELALYLSRQTGLRVTIIAPDGRLIGESGPPPAAPAGIENALQRPEVQAALKTGQGIASRRSAGLGGDLLCLAMALRHDERLAGIVHVAAPLQEIEQTTRRVRRIVLGATAVVAVAGLPVLFLMARRPGVAIETIRAAAARAAGGDLTVRADVESADELGELGAALNEVTGQLQERVKELSRERAELEATLSNMVEGVLVVDAGGRIRIANRALCERLRLPESAPGKTVLEVFRNAALQDLVARALAGQHTSATELTFFGGQERVFSINAAGLRGADGLPAGAVVVFHDITRLKQLENIRKEFVANVSHELRTPLSIIKGYVETLLEEQPGHPFLQTIQKHARRMESLIDDLLNISELESHQARLQFGPVSLRAAMDEELIQRAADKKIELTVELPDTPARADAERLRQVFTNLLDNAIKYARRRIRVTGLVHEDEIEVCIADDGPGISPEHLPRIFERFYRVDKARSRQLGGTGLGLAIVKHIVQAHGGRVWAESRLGAGSSFYFTLPRA